jgi:hypothetical protein
MKFQLVIKNTGDIITVTDSRVFGLDEAKAYYIRMKQLKEKEFDKLYTVEEYKRPKGMPSRINEHTGRNLREYKWWIEEKEITDEALIWKKLK